MKTLFFICLFLFTAKNLFSQGNNATVSATIVNPVGAEFSDVELTGNFFKKTQEIKSFNASGKNEIERNNSSFIKIIGESFSHHVMIENDISVKKDKRK